MIWCYVCKGFEALQHYGYHGIAQIYDMGSIEHVHCIDCLFQRAFCYRDSYSPTAHCIVWVSLWWVNCGRVSEGRQLSIKHQRGLSQHHGQQPCVSLIALSEELGGYHTRLAISIGLRAEGQLHSATFSAFLSKCAKCHLAGWTGRVHSSTTNRRAPVWVWLPGN